jgi:hypothetical protein
MTTPNLGLPELSANQEQPHLPHNEALRKLDIASQLVVISHSLTAPPGSPDPGDSYIVAGTGGTATGAWAGKENQIAFYNSGWQFLIPKTGWFAYIDSIGTRYQYEAGSPGHGWNLYVPGAGAFGIDVGDDQSPPNTVAAATALTFVGASVSLASPSEAIVTIASVALGVAGGAASLDGGGKVPVSQLPATVVGSVDYQGTWNANTNSPDLPASSPTKGDYFVVSVAGATSLGGITDWAVNDWAIYNGSIWQKLDNSPAGGSSVTSVAGRTGAIVLGTGDIAGVATSRFLGRATAGSGVAEELTAAQAYALLQAQIPIEYQVALSDLATALTTGTTKAYMRAPRAFTLTAVRSSVLLESSSGLVTVDVNVNGSTILSTKLSIDASEKTSVTAATAAVISTPAIADDDLIEFDIDAAGTGAKGLIVTLIGHA